MELIERVARAICCEGHQCAGERLGRKCQAGEQWSNEAKAAIRAMLDGVEPVEFRYTHANGDEDIVPVQGGLIYSLDALKEAVK